MAVAKGMTVTLDDGTRVELQSAKEAYQIRVAKALQLITQTPRGQILAFLQLAKYMGMEECSLRGQRGPLYSVMQRVKTLAREKHGLFVIVKHGEGYYSVPFGQEIDVCHDKYFEGRRRCDKAIKMTNDIRLTALDAAQKSRAIEVQQQLLTMHMLAGPAPERKALESVA